MRPVKVPPVLCALALAVAMAGTIAAAEESSDAEEIDYSALKSPVLNTEKSIARGRLLYLRTCTECHGMDGKAQMDVIADATDLTNPEFWRNGTKEGEIYRSIREGAGEAMPPYKFQIRRDEDLWNLVNYIRSLWPADVRPPVVNEEEAEASEASDDEGERDE